MGRVMAEDAFEAVVAQHHAEIHRYLVRVTARASDADDLSQEPLLRAFRAHGSLPPEPRFRLGLRVIAAQLSRLCCRGGRRRRLAYAAARAAVPSVDPSRPDGRVLGSEASAGVDAIVAALPAKQGLAF